MSDWLDELADPRQGEIVEWRGRKLRVGAFYWVMPANDPDIQPGQGWEWFEQPARFAGVDADGRLLWQCLNVEGASDWDMRFIGDEIARLKP